MAYMNRGNAKRSASDHGPNAAIPDYDAAIALMNTLRAELEPAGHWEVGLRNDLAGAYMNRGNAKRDASGHGLGAALADYDTAIALRKALRAELEPAGRWEVGLRNDLANAYVACGIAKLDASGHGPGAALADFDAAIKLMEALRAELEPAGRWEVGLRNDLANAYVACGLAKAQASGHGPGAALSDYDAAIDLLRPFLEGPLGSRLPFMVNVASRAFGGKANALLASHDAPAATDAAAEGLLLLKELEIGGTFWLRSLRESLFETTLNAYVQARQLQFLPEIILEHLEPTHPGAAPTSVAMHEAAARYLRQAAADLYLQPKHPQALLDEFAQTLHRLETLHTLYFGGTATSARLQAAERERTDGPALAQQVLERYTDEKRGRGKDPEGYLALAEFLVRHRQNTAAITAYQDAAIALLGNVPARGEMEPYIARVAEIAALILKLKLLQQPLPATLDRDATFRLLLSALNLSHWLYSEFPNALFAAPRWQSTLQRLTGRTERWRDALTSALKPVAAQIETYLHDLLGKFETTTRQQALDQARGELCEQGQAMARTLCLGLGIPWDAFSEGVTAAWLERWTFLQQDWHRGDETQRRALEEQLAEGLAHTVSELTRQLHQEALATSDATLQAALGPIWNLLHDSDEGRFLACGHHWLSQLHQPESARFAGLELGLAVETGLLNRLFAPLKAWLVKSGQCHHIALDPDDWSYKAGLFLAGKTSAVEFGPMAGAFGRTLKHPPEELAGYYRHLAAYLDSLPNPKPLRVATARKRRVANLGQIKDWRNQCAHPKTPPTNQDLQAMWNLVVADPEHAFFRYFGAALLPPPDPATRT
ncbi:MAG: hypothetical protein P9F19_19790 [Candidatus Contendobacter sp.]|nr:hypothetical protein [Candidatus Contendobacter sp.]